LIPQEAVKDVATLTKETAKAVAGTPPAAVVVRETPPLTRDVPTAEKRAVAVGPAAAAATAVAAAQRQHTAEREAFVAGTSAPGPVEERVAAYAPERVSTPPSTTLLEPAVPGYNYVPPRDRDVIPGGGT
jgi:hypothetical protein